MLYSSSGLYTLSHGRSEQEKKEVNVSKLDPGSFGTFEFGEDQSCNMAFTRNTRMNYMFDRDSIYSVKTGADTG